MRPVGAAETLDRLVGAPARLQQVVDAAVGVGAGQIGVVAAPGPAGHGEHQDALGAVHEGGGLGEVGRRRPRAQRQTLAACASVILSTRRERPVTSATASCPKCCTIWSSADGTGGRAASFSISASRLGDSASWQMHGVAVGIRRTRPAHQVAARRR